MPPRPYFNRFQRPQRLPPAVMNHNITHPEVRVIGAQEENLGVMKTADAIKLAQGQGLDLIEVSAKAKPPVTRIMELGKFLYQKSKDEKRKKTKSQELKSVRLSLGTGKHDLEVKARKVEEFIAEGNQVEIRMFLRGREKANRDFAKRKLLEFLPLIHTQFRVTMEPKYVGNGFALQIVKHGVSS